MFTRYLGSQGVSGSKLAILLPTNNVAFTLDDLISFIKLHNSYAFHVDI